MPKKVDMTGWNMWEHGISNSRVHVIKENGCSYGHITWLCQCSCGKIFTAIGNYLRNGTTKSCGCLRKEKNYDRFKIDMIHKKFGLLTVLEELPERDHKGYLKYKCKCECGNICIVQGQYLRSGDTKSCGCLSSIGEANIVKLLQKYNIIYKQQHTFSNLISPTGARLRFDFAIFDDNNNLKCLIEYQGEQHYKDFGIFGALQRETTDELKRQYCKNEHLLLFEIAYYENLNERIEQILKSL